MYYDDLLYPTKRPFVTTRGFLELPRNTITGADNLNLITHTLAGIAYKMVHPIVYQVEDGVLPEVGKGFVAALSAGLR